MGPLFDVGSPNGTLMKYFVPFECPIRTGQAIDLHNIWNLLSRSKRLTSNVGSNQLFRMEEANGENMPCSRTRAANVRILNKIVPLIGCWDWCTSRNGRPTKHCSKIRPATSNLSAVLNGLIRTQADLRNAQNLRTTFAGWEVHWRVVLRFLHLANLESRPVAFPWSRLCRLQFLTTMFSSIAMFLCTLLTVGVLMKPLRKRA